ncbi:hypothetical protein I5535_08820 [Rhodobacteraceae bacterium F11138]|nr:hypothetical protein [Rhodobacteraceae bacterium F11138]
MSISFFRPDRPSPTVWSDRPRGPDESALDCETAVTLACHLNPVFANAPDWDSLIETLAAAGFQLQFQDTRLVLVNIMTGVVLCTCAFLGHSLATLSERLGKPCVLADTGQLVPNPARR